MIRRGYQVTEATALFAVRDKAMYVMYSVNILRSLSVVTVQTRTGNKKTSRRKIAEKIVLFTNRMNYISNKTVLTVSQICAARR